MAVDALDEAYVKVNWKDVDGADEVRLFSGKIIKIKNDKKYVFISTQYQTSSASNILLKKISN